MRPEERRRDNNLGRQRRRSQTRYDRNRPDHPSTQLPQFLVTKRTTAGS
jgi:hypothetical protein